MLFIFFIACLVATWFYLNAPSENKKENSIFLVRSGETVSYIARNLQDQKYIKNYNLFLIYHRLLDSEGGINIGSYDIPQDATTWQIYQKLINGEQDFVSVTVPEGWTLKNIATLLDEKGVVSSDKFLEATEDPELLKAWSIEADNFEGYLFPDTYHFPLSYDASFVVGVFLENFQNKIDLIYPDWRELTAKQLHDKVIMASIVEREYRSAEEAPLIASVFYNRLDSWYPRLESCATVTYIITDILNKPHPSRLTNRDIEMDHPYNTYEHGGLPPGPISNPGRVALEAAFNPAETNYIYFVVKDPEEGTHNFSSNYEEFQRNKYDYLRNFRSK